MFPSLQPFDFDTVMPQEYKEKMKNGQALTQEERENLFNIVYTTLDGILQKCLS
jgi:gluconate kinase